MFIRTERLFLRPGWPEDVSELLELVNDDPVVRSGGLMRFPRSRAALREFLARAWDPLFPRFLITLRGEDGPRLIGGIGLGRSGPDVEIDYWIARRHRGAGYAAEAVRAVLAQARALGHRQVVAAPGVDCAAAVRVLQESGFKPAEDIAPRFERGRGEQPVRLHVAVLADKLFDIMGVAPQHVRA